jgi:hypothetical protein
MYHLTCCRFLQSPIIKVIVRTAEAQRTIFVHQGIICDRSEFFKKALTWDWVESQEKKVELPEDDPAIFALYQELLYAGYIPIAKEARSDDQPLMEISFDAEEYLTLGKLYVLTEKLVDATTKDNILDAFLARSQQPADDGSCHFPALDCVALVYDGTPENDPARALLVKFYNDEGRKGWLEDDKELASKEFLYDLCASMLDKRPRPAKVVAKSDFRRIRPKPAKD